MSTKLKLKYTDYKDDTKKNRWRIWTIIKVSPFKASVVACVTTKPQNIHC